MSLRTIALVLVMTLVLACGGNRGAAVAPSRSVAVASASATPLIDVTDMMGAFPAATFLVITSDGLKGFALLNHALKYTIPLSGKDIQVVADDQNARFYVIDRTSDGARLRRFDAATGVEMASQLVRDATPIIAPSAHAAIAIDRTIGVVYTLLRHADGVAVDGFDWFTLDQAAHTPTQLACTDRLAAAKGRIVVACSRERGVVVFEGGTSYRPAQLAINALAMLGDGTVLAQTASGGSSILLRLPGMRDPHDFDEIAALEKDLGVGGVAEGIAANGDCCFFVAVRDGVDRPQVRYVAKLSGIGLIAFPQSTPPVGGLFVSPPFAYYVFGGAARHLDITQGFAEVMAQVGDGTMPAAVVNR